MTKIVIFENKKPYHNNLILMIVNQKKGILRRHVLYKIYSKVIHVQLHTHAEILLITQTKYNTIKAAVGKVFWDIFTFVDINYPVTWNTIYNGALILNVL